jgi:D-beta-D-heptose 7-phosphate kinase/D-beta-D-heptose 1-phosphate adenosyltransferase
MFDVNVQNQIIALSGAFDVLHPGHIRMIKGAEYFGKVVIFLNSDEWVKRNKGFLLMPWSDRREMLLSVTGVHSVERVNDEDDTVCEALMRLKPNIFGNGGNRTHYNTPERRLCNEMGIACVWGIGGGERDKYSNEILEKMFSAERPQKIAKK